MGKQITKTKPSHLLLIICSAVLTLIVSILVITKGTSTKMNGTAQDLTAGHASIGFYNLSASSDFLSCNVSATVVGWLTLVLAVLAIIPLVFYSVHSKKINWIQVASVILALVPVVIIVALASNDLAKTIYKVGNGDNFAKLNGTGWVVFVIAILGIVASVAAIGLSSYSSYKNYKKGPSSSK